jgi:hypothetical protein
MATRGVMGASLSEKKMHYPVMTERQLALRWKISLKTLRRWRLDGEGPIWHKLFQHVRYHVDDPKAWYQAALIAFRDGDYVAACTYLRRGIAANPYIAEGLTGRTVLSEHLYWHASNVHGPEWAVDYLDSAACDWTPEEIDFVDWVFNASPVLKERAEMMALHEGMT